MFVGHIVSYVIRLPINVYNHTFELHIPRPDGRCVGSPTSNKDKAKLEYIRKCKPSPNSLLTFWILSSVEY